MSDVAAAAGVSLKTVSRVVNEEPGVRRETAEIVPQTIAQLGFRRNDLARALRHGRRSGLFGLVIEDVSNPFYSTITRGVEEVTRSAASSRSPRARTRTTSATGPSPPVLRAASRRSAGRARR
jgi:LacI family transcriptional regulator